MQVELPQTLIPQVPLPTGYKFGDIQLEMSLKPFYDTSPATRESVLREVFLQWQALTRHAESISIMLWIAEGSEILEYNGQLESRFEWARYHGAPNRHRWELPKQGRNQNPDHEGIGLNTGEYDPEGKGIHSRCYLYRPEPAVFDYAWLKALVSDIKRIGGEVSGKKILVGETFDIGPEFALSRFKFDWHREILGNGPIFKEQFITCEAILKGDQRCYAAYPKGIPDQTPFGEFFGQQLNAFFKDMGFDFLWLSNGFGFSLEPWAMVGEVFDGQTYHPERSAGIQQRVLKFWKDLRKGFPKRYHIRTRGTNLATGIDLGSDASPLKAIYEGDFAMDAPVNSPWAALDGDFGLELTGWMSHIIQHPGKSFRFRFYSHDPWWLNSPWLDRYQRKAHDLLLPLSVSLIHAGGEVEIPRDIAFLSVDDSHGRLPLSVPNEIIPQLLRARESAPDAAGPLVWVYPFDEFQQLTVQAGRPDIPLHADAYLGSCVNDGCPINTVVDARDFNSARSQRIRGGAVYICSVPPAGSLRERELFEALAEGEQVLLYGPLPQGSLFLETLGITLAEPLAGDIKLLDDLHSNGLPEFREWGQRMLRHTSILSGGAFCEAPKVGDDIVQHSRGVIQGQVRVLIACQDRRTKGKLVWTRACLSTAEFDPEHPAPIKGPILKPLNSAHFVASGSLLRWCLYRFGWSIFPLHRGVEQRSPYLTVHRHQNAAIFSGYHRDEHSEIHLRSPLGAPVFVNANNRIEKGHTVVSGQNAWQNECRIFYHGQDTLQLKCMQPPPLMHGVRRRLLVLGLKGGSLSFMPETGHSQNLRILRDPHFPYFVGQVAEVKVNDGPYGPMVLIENCLHDILIEW